MAHTKFEGTGVALITPFTSDNQVDYTALGSLLEHVIEGGVEFLVVFGTTGEPITISKQEKTSILDFVYTKVNKRLPIVVGCGGNNTDEVIEAASNIDSSRFDAILSVVPYYNKPNQRGMYAHYKAVAEASTVPVLAYNVPGRTGCNMEAETSIKIAHEIPNIIGLKEASPSVEQFTYIKRSVPKDFLVISGDDSIVVPHMSLGAAGAISVTANAMPRMYSNMVRLCKANKFPEALDLHMQLIEFTDSLFMEGSPAGVKAALHYMGIVQNTVRMPLVPVTQKHYDYIASLVKQLQ
ncbi:MAG TPA: 4-hydroxy-tetrahydrodipicolinate synthase [Bacteroidales bacterium]|nr:4-hydroxy-tetrahydrodipicolinate synthase [Bacteroidales bacterium]